MNAFLETIAELCDEMLRAWCRNDSPPVHVKRSKFTPCPSPETCEAAECSSKYGRKK